MVFLQEVDKGSAEALGRKSGLVNFRFAKDEGLRVGEYGAATMSRLKLVATQLYTLPETAQGYDVILRTEARRRKVAHPGQRLLPGRVRQRGKERAAAGLPGRARHTRTHGWTLDSQRFTLVWPVRKRNTGFVAVT